jgi:protein-disulfide isomerase
MKKSLLNLFACGLALLMCLGCAAQSANPDLDKRIEHQVRAFYNIPATVSITIGQRKPSPEFPNYEALSVTFASEQRKQTQDFLVSKDGTTLVRMTKLDLTKDPYAQIMSKIDLSGRPVRGNQNAKVTIVNFDDFQCPYCAQMHQALTDQILKNYGDKVKLVYKDYPLMEIHPWAKHAAIDASCLAGTPSAYWGFADTIHSAAHVISQTRGMADQVNTVDKLALEQGQKANVDLPQLQACLKAQKDDKVNASIAEAESLEVNATPTLFVNGRKIDGAVPIEELRAVIDRALADVGETPPALSLKPAGGGN